MHLFPLISFNVNKHNRHFYFLYVFVICYETWNVVEKLISSPVQPELIDAEKEPVNIPITNEVIVHMCYVWFYLGYIVRYNFM